MPRWNPLARPSSAAFTGPAEAGTAEGEAGTRRRSAQLRLCCPHPRLSLPTHSQPSLLSTAHPSLGEHSPRSPTSSSSPSLLRFAAVIIDDQPLRFSTLHNPPLTAGVCNYNASCLSAAVRSGYAALR